MIKEKHISDMKQKDKELLLKDLCPRLPHGQIVQISLFRNDGIRRDIELDPHITENIWEMIDKYHAIPYLRPMSSMTEEEKREYFSFIGGKRPFDCDFSAYPIEYTFIYEHNINSYIDWLNKHHFDYRGLIEKGLALEAPEGMYEK